MSDANTRRKFSDLIQSLRVWDNLWPFVDMEGIENGMNLGKHGHFLGDSIFEMDQDKVH